MWLFVSLILILCQNLCKCSKCWEVKVLQQPQILLIFRPNYLPVKPKLSKIILDLMPMEMPFILALVVEATTFKEILFGNYYKIGLLVLKRVVVVCKHVNWFVFWELRENLVKVDLCKKNLVICNLVFLLLNMTAKLKFYPWLWNLNPQVKDPREKSLVWLKKVIWN